MEDRPDTGLAKAFGAALDWWRDAGVDHAYHDEPQAWISPLPPEEAPEAERLATEAADPVEAAAATPPHAVDRSSWPADLTGFAEWWLTSPVLDGGRIAGRVPPRGDKGASLMVIVPEPEREDDTRLLSGPEGRLLDAILAAMGVPHDRTYIASALPRHTPAADWQAMAASGIGDVLRHHIALAAPQRVVAFGGNILPLLGHDLPQGSAVLRRFNHEGFSVPLLAARSLSTLFEMPFWKRDLWRVWLDWTDQVSAG